MLRMPTFSSVLLSQSGLGPIFDAADHAGGVARAQVRVFDPHRHQFLGPAAGFVELGFGAASAGLPVRALISRAMPMTLLRSGRLGVISRS